MGPSNVQGETAPKNHFGLPPDNGVPKPHLRMGQRSQGASQVHWHGRGSSQRQTRFLLFPHGLADVEKAQGCFYQGKDGGLEWFRGRSGCHVPEEVSNYVTKL